MERPLLTAAEKKRVAVQAHTLLFMQLRLSVQKDTVTHQRSLIIVKSRSLFCEHFHSAATLDFLIFYCSAKLAEYQMQYDTSIGLVSILPIYFQLYYRRGLVQLPCQSCILRNILLTSVFLRLSSQASSLADKPTRETLLVTTFDQAIRLTIWTAYPAPLQSCL